MTSVHTLDHPGPAQTAVLPAIAVAALSLAGFINLAPTGGVLLATVIVDACVAAMAGLALLQLANEPTARVYPWVVALVALAVTYLALMVGGTESLSSELSTWRNVALYAFAAVYTAYCLRSQEQAERLTSLAIGLAGVLALFGVAQALLAARLPGFLLEPKDAVVFGYYGTDIVRSNGLIGNTIVYATYLTLMVAVTWARWLERRGRFLLAVVGLLLVAIYLTYSRAAMAGSVVVLAGIFVVTRRDVLRASLRALALAVGLALGVLVAFATPLRAAIESSFAYRELFLGQNASVQGSNAAHAMDVTLGIQQFSANPWIGTGVASQAQFSTLSEYGISITDGAFWARLAETGLLGMTAHLAVVVTAAATLCRLAVRRGPGSSLALGLLAFTIFQFMGAAFVNSAFYGKTPFVMYWILFGAAVAQNRLALACDPAVSSRPGSSVERVAR
ncbi:hypothetical protein OMK64_08855 [Cellulomonas fimi]|uniref:O-antigen ligase family protein n=1 Tax=Cellulomonas fimi TaxID=1708 RepID=UPI00234DF505|nr:O-antigen ligase family protein [Cellulomonas fimi]MDC7121645.1 hypothetical protein [Cellulomonas fimi]